MNKIIDHEKIIEELSKPIDTSNEKINLILEKARKLKGIDYDEVITLLRCEDKNLAEKIFETAKYIKDEIYGNRLVVFAPLYVSNLCQNECLYCAFRAKNQKLARKALTQEEIKEEVEILLSQGHKRVLLVAGESLTHSGLKYVLESIETIYNTKTEKGNIRRVNVNIAPLEVDQFKELAKYKIGTYQLFQETYHEETYKQLHLKGPKSNYQYRLEVMDRALEAGIHDVGIGVLFGLYDWKYEILALLQHIKHLENKFGVGPHTISVPRMEPALDSDISYNPPYAVDDYNFKKIIAVLRIAIPYTGIILSTRESPEMRREAFELGVSQISGGSRTNPGGYKHDDLHVPEVPEGLESQFSLGDTRSLTEVISDIVDRGHIPSFCTGCYRLGRVGKDFMDLAKPGLIKQHCMPNALLTFAEFLYDFADEKLKAKGLKLIDEMLEKEIKKPKLKEHVKNLLEDVKNGKRDIYL